MTVPMGDAVFLMNGKYYIFRKYLEACQQTKHHIK